MNERVPLSFLIAQNKDEEPRVEPVVPFPAMFGEDPKIVTAVLENTAVLASTDDRYERIARRHDQVYVDPAAIEWRTKTATYEGARLNEEARNRRGVGKSPWRVEMATTYEKLEGSRAEQRTRSDERALENQKQVQETADTNRRLLRLRQPVTPAQPEEKEAMIVQRQPFIPTADVARSTATVTSSTTSIEKLKRCKRCGEDKARSEFAATGIYGGYCSTCEPLEKAERAAARGGKPAKASEPKKKRKYTRRAGPETTTVTVGLPSNGYDNVIKLLHRRDALKVELAKLNEQLQEALA